MNEFPIERRDFFNTGACLLCGVLCAVSDEGLCIHCRNASQPLPEFNLDKKAKGFDKSNFQTKNTEWA